MDQLEQHCTFENQPPASRYSDAVAAYVHESSV